MKSITSTLVPLALFATVVMASSRKAYGGLDGENHTFKTMVAVHGALMAFAFAILFPLGAALLRLLKRPSVVNIHAGIQVTALVIALVAFGIGIWMVRHTSINQNLWKPFNGHTIIGTIVISFLLIQPIGGAIHHSMYRKRAANTSVNTTTGSTPVGVAHRWIGRLFLILAAINGGLGFQLAKESSGVIIAYSILCAIFYSLWAFALFRKGRAAPRTEKHGPAVRV